MDFMDLIIHVFLGAYAGAHQNLKKASAVVV